jgi:hypothetical protein
MNRNFLYLFISLCLTGVWLWMLITGAIDISNCENAINASYKTVYITQYLGTGNDPNVNCHYNNNCRTYYEYQLNNGCILWTYDVLSINSTTTSCNQCYIPSEGNITSSCNSAFLGFGIAFFILQMLINVSLYACISKNTNQPVNNPIIQMV